MLLKLPLVKEEVRYYDVGGYKELGLKLSPYTMFLTLNVLIFTLFLLGAATATQAAAPTPAPAPASGQPAHDAYYDVFWQYAGYYGEEAARKHYGAWSPPVGTPNPNGNSAPSAVPAPQAAAAAAPQPAPAPAVQATQEQISQAQANTTDSSVRKVSNLPAWMTKQ